MLFKDALSRTGLACRFAQPGCYSWHYWLGLGRSCPAILDGYPNGKEFERHEKKCVKLEKLHDPPRHNYLSPDENLLAFSFISSIFFTFAILKLEFGYQCSAAMTESKAGQPAATSPSGQTNPSNDHQPPTQAMDAVLVQSTEMPADAQKVEELDFNKLKGRPITVDDLYQGMKHMGFQASSIGDAIRIINDMVGGHSLLYTDANVSAFEEISLTHSSARGGTPRPATAPPSSSATRPT